MKIKRPIKINKSQVILFLLFVIAVLTLSSCTKPECKTSADCLTKTCNLPKCENKKCSYTLQRNCCGNRINESIENGKHGNQCTCPQDYGKCQGKGKIKVGSRTEDAAYVHYSCNSEEQCVFDVDKKDIVPQNFLDSINPGFFKASIIVKYNKPFDVDKDSFEFIIKLDDFSKDAELPVTLTNIKLLLTSYNSRQEQLISNKDMDNVLSNIGQSVTLKLPLNLNYKPKELEEIGLVRYIIEYTFTKKVPFGKSADGTTLYKGEIVRDRFTALPKQVFLVTTG